MSYATVLKNPNIRVLAISNAFGKMALATVGYGSMVHLARLNASQFEISLVGSGSYLAALLFGFQGGTAADSVAKRVAVAGGHAVLAAVCILTPILLGTNAAALVVLSFLTSLLMQIVTPGLKAATALVSTPAELATTSALVSVVGSAASGIGSAFLAPLLIKTTDINVVLMVGALFFVLGGIRALKLPNDSDQSTREAFRNIDWKPRALSLRGAARFIVDRRPVATMILAGAIVISLYEGFNTLIPKYVSDVLGQDPANAVYIFAPAGLGLLAGTLLMPHLIERYHERWLTITAVIIMSVCMSALGFIDVIAPILNPINPLRLLELFGLHINSKILAAALISIPLNFGSTISGAAVMTFINRTVPVSRQGATFGAQGVIANAASLLTVLSFGVIATIVGIRLVMVVAPAVIIWGILWLLRYSFKNASKVELSRHEAWNLLGADDVDATNLKP